MSRPGWGFFITGTDTDVGKTIAAAAVLASIRSRGIDAVPMKPVQTGGVSRGGALASPDLRFCIEMAGLDCSDEDIQNMSPYIFEPACSPHLASAKDGRAISFDRIAGALAALLERHECVVVEGAGGLLVPVSPDKTMLDLMVLLNLPVIVVARPCLGTINHTLLTLRELERSGLSVQGVLFCETKPVTWGEIEEDNWKTIERIAKTHVLGCIPFMEGLAEGEISAAAFRDRAIRNLHLPCVGEWKDEK